MASFNFALISNFRVSKQTLKPNGHFLSILLLMKTQEEGKWWQPPSKTLTKSLLCVQHYIKLQPTEFLQWPNKEDGPYSWRSGRWESHRARNCWVFWLILDPSPKMRNHHTHCLSVLPDVWWELPTGLVMETAVLMKTAASCGCDFSRVLVCVFMLSHLNFWAAQRGGSYIRAVENEVNWNRSLRPKTAHLSFIVDFLFQSEFCEENKTLLLLLLVLSTDSRTLNKLASVLNLNYTLSPGNRNFNIYLWDWICPIQLSMSSGITKKKMKYFIS